MSHALNTLFEEVRPFARRIRRKEKENFLTYAEQELKNSGFTTNRLEKQGKFLGLLPVKSVNLETTATHPEYIILAHYDTPTIIPFWIEPLVRLIGHTRQVVLSLALLIVILIFSFLPGVLGWLAVLLYVSLLLFFVPNPKNYNDNTSGVLGLLYLAKQVGASAEYRNKVKFVLVDNEEFFLMGADHLRDIWRAQNFEYQKAQIISLDCIGWGEIPTIVRNGTSALGEALVRVFQKKDEKSQLINMGMIPLNDNYIFKSQGAVVVTLMNPTQWKGGFYIKNIHSPLDNKLDVNKIAWVGDRITEFMVNNKV